MTEQNVKLTNALSHHKVGDLVSAETGYLGILRSDPGSAVALYLLGTLKAQQKNYPEAIDYLQRSLDIKPDDVNVIVNLGNAYAESGNMSAAVDCFRDALRLDPGMSYAGILLGRILLSMRRYSDAANAFRAVISENPAHEIALMLLARALMFEGKLDEATANVQRSLRAQPNLAAAHATQGDIFTRQGKYADADRCYRRASELDTKDASIYWRWGDLQRTRENMIEARNKYEQAVCIDPDDINCQSRYGMALLLTGPEEKLSVLAALDRDHVYGDASEATSLARALAKHYDYKDTAAGEALTRMFDNFNPNELHSTAWWNGILETFGPSVNAHDRILRGVMSAVFSWSIPTSEVIERIAQFADGARLNSIGAGTGYWEYLLANHFGVRIRAADIKLKHRFIPMEAGGYLTAPIDVGDVVFLAWIPEGVDDSLQVLKRMARGQRLVLVGETPDKYGVAQTCGTCSFYSLLNAQFKLVDTLIPARYNYFMDSVYLYVKRL